MTPTPRKKKNTVPKEPTKPRITAEQRKDWRTLPTVDWNVLTFLSYFADMNAEQFGVAEYVPFHNWRVEQGMLKRELTAHGPELLRDAFDEAFRTHRPPAQYPILTAGFACSFVINGLLPRLMAERARKEADMKRAEVVTNWDEINGWL